MSVPWECEACRGTYYGNAREPAPRLCDCGREALGLRALARRLAKALVASGQGTEEAFALLDQQPARKQKP